MNMVLPHPVVYVTRDIERALGTKPANNYFIIANKTPYAESIQKQYGENVLLFSKENGDLFDTYELLEQANTLSFIKKQNAAILVFQNTKRIEHICTEHGLKLLNPKAELARTVEEKISQVLWLKDYVKYLPKHEITTLEKLKLEDWSFPFVLQFNHAHTGEGTHIIKSEIELENLKKQFPKRDIRVTRFIEGPVFTLNTVVGADVYFGNISYQITGLVPFTDFPFATIGNDWKLPHKTLSSQEQEYIRSIAKSLGNQLKQDGWRGIFGIDIIQDSKTREIFLLEINARQPASTTLESILQTKIDSGKENVFEKHIRTLQGLENIEGLTQLTNGAQIVQRVTNSFTKKSTRLNEATLPPSVFNTIHYSNTEINKDLMRIQSTEGILESHGVLNSQGRAIASSITHI